MAFDPALLDWLLDADPALRWQVERDLAGAPPEVWGATRARIATEGFGARLLALQDPDGQWAGGAFFPKDFDFRGPEAAEGAGQPWTATTWTLNTLRDWGLDAAALAGTAELLARNSRWEYNDLPVLGRRSRLLHQRLHPRQRRVAWGGRLRNRPVVPRPPHGRRRLELRVGGGLHALVVPFHPQFPQGPVVLRGRYRRQPTRSGRFGGPARNTCFSAVCSAPCPQASPSGRGRPGSRTRSAGSTARSTRQTTSGQLPCTTVPRRIRGLPTRSKRSAPRAVPTAPGCRRFATPGGCGSTSTWRPESRPNGSRSTARACWHGGIARAAPRTAGTSPLGTVIVRKGRYRVTHGNQQH